MARLLLIGGRYVYCYYHADYFQAWLLGVCFLILSSTDVSLLIETNSDEYRFLAGVTRTLNISYLKAIPLGTRVHPLLQITHCTSIDHLTSK